MLPNLMRIASRSSVYSLLCWLLVAVAPHGLAQNYQGKQLVKAELLADTTAIVADKPGYVFSPFDSSGRYVDVSGYTPGTKVKDPWTDKIFVVP